MSIIPQDRLQHFEHAFASAAVWRHFFDLPAPTHMLGDPLVLIRALRPETPLVPRVVIEAILLSKGSIGSTQEVARQLGLPNRFTLARILKRAGLPSLHRLAEWATVESWLRAAEEEHVSLCSLAFRSRRHPSACYRLVKELTGLRWGELRARGLHWFQRLLVRQLLHGRN